MAPKTATELYVEQHSTNKTKPTVPKEASIFTTETDAKHLALNIDLTNNSKIFIIHSDSISVLLSIKNKNVAKLIIIKSLNILNSMSHIKKVIFCWIPSHIGIQENHEADLIAKSVLDMIPNKNSKIPYTDLKPKIC